MQTQDQSNVGGLEMRGRLSVFRICRVTGICFQSAGGPAHSKTFRDLRGRVEHAPVFGVRQFSAAFRSQDEVDKIELRLSLD